MKPSDIIYLNWRGPAGRETVDSVDPADWPSLDAAKAEASRLVCEYALAGMPGVYQSSREIIR